MHMFLHRAGTDAENDGDLWIRFAERRPMSDFHFATRENPAQARVTFRVRVSIDLCDGDSISIEPLG